MAPDRPHVLLIPIPFQSHVNPMLHIASRLVSRGCSVTFLYNQLSHKAILNAHRPSRRRESYLHLDIQFVAIPDQLPPTLEINHDTLPRIMDDMQNLQGALEDLIESSRLGSNPISCIISNCLSPWAQDVARAARLPGIMFWPSNATVLLLSRALDLGQLTSEDLERGQLHLGSLHIDSAEVLSSVLPNSSREGKSFKALRETTAKASHILINSFEALEGFLDPTKPEASNMRYIGPCLPMELLECECSDDNTNKGECASTEDVEYLEWLDSRAAGSVLFMSFGSIASFPPDQIEQFAMGIEESKLNFLWVVRPDATGKSPSIPEGFVDRTKGRGRVIPWAQQLQVLQHPAIGGFMMHCGWNSTLESICMGVPMLCLPLFAEQSINRHMIVNEWRVGMALDKDEDGRVKKEDVERAARKLMVGEEGRALRKRAGELKEAARVAVREDELSSIALEELLENFVTDLKVA